MPLRLFSSNSSVMRNGVFIRLYQFIANGSLTVFCDAIISYAFPVIPPRRYPSAHLSQRVTDRRGIPCFRQNAIPGFNDIVGAAAHG